MRQPSREWIQNNLSSLTAHTDDLRGVGTTIDEPEFGAWTALKLVVLTATIDVYSTVISNNDFDFYYVDAMSGSGLVNLSDRDDTLIGSPFIAGTVAHEPFSRMYLIERNEDRANVLRERLDYAVDEIDSFDQSRKDYVVLTGDANEILPTIPDRIKRERGGTLAGTNGEGGAHHLAFIDNERSEVKFDAIRQLSKMWGDLLINYQEKGLNRQYGRIDNGLEDSWDEFLAFFDDDERVKQLDSPEDRFALYRSKIESINRPMQESVQIHGSKSHPYGYRMLYATQQTGGGSEYAQFMEGQARKIEDLTGDDIETVLDTMRGNATHLGLWSTNEDEKGQAKLGEY